MSGTASTTAHSPRASVLVLYTSSPFHGQRLSRNFAPRGVICQCILKHFFPIRGDVLCVLCCRLFQCSAPAHHIMVNAWHAWFVLFLQLGLFRALKCNPSRNRQRGAAQVLPGCQSPNKHNNQIEDGVWTGGLFKKRHDQGRTCQG